MISLCQLMLLCSLKLLPNWSLQPRRPGNSDCENICLILLPDIMPYSVLHSTQKVMIISLSLTRHSRKTYHHHSKGSYFNTVLRMSDHICRLYLPVTCDGRGFVQETKSRRSQKWITNTNQDDYSLYHMLNQRQNQVLCFSFLPITSQHASENLTKISAGFKSREQVAEYCHPFPYLWGRHSDNNSKPSPPSPPSTKDSLFSHPALT